MATKASIPKRPQKGKQDARFMRGLMIRADEQDSESRRVKLSFSSEEPYERWFGPEILDHTEGAADLRRLNDIGCVLFNHNRDIVIGKILSAEIADGRGEAEIEFDTDEKSEEIFQKVKSGTLKGTSVQYRVDCWEEVAPNKKSSDGRFTGPCSIARKWTALEISVVSVPADASVGVGRDMEESAPLALYHAERQIQINKNKMGGK